MMEALVLSAVLVSGALVLRTCGLRGWGLLPLGFLTGTFLIVVVGAILVVFALPTRPSVMLGVLAVSALAAGSISWFRRDRILGRDWVVIGVGLLALTGAVFAFRDANLVSYHIDSFRYLASSGLLAADAYALATPDLLTKRLLAAPVMHSLAWLHEEQYVRSFSPLLMLALLGSVAWIVRQGYGQARGTFLQGRGAAVAIGIGLLLLVTNNRMVWNSFYINDHLFFAAAFLPACSLGWLLARGRSDLAPGMVAVAALGLAGLVVTRPEGFIAGAFALLPLFVQRSVPLWVRRVVLAAYGAATSSWYGYVALRSHSELGEIHFHTVGPLIVGLLALATIPALRWIRHALEHRNLLIALEVTLWLGLAAFAIRDSRILIRSLEATYLNVVAGEGSWGSSLVLLALLVVFVVLLNRDRTVVSLRFPLTAFVPTFFLIAYLQDSSYRVGHGDSLNRMLMQIVPLAVLYLLASLRSEEWRLDAPAGYEEAQAGVVREAKPVSR